MRLTVNGVPVRVVDRIEIVLEVPEDGDTILNGVVMTIKGGPLTIYPGQNDNSVTINHGLLFLNCNPGEEWLGANQLTTFPVSPPTPSVRP